VNNSKKIYPNIMKKISTILLFSLSLYAFSQIGIETTVVHQQAIIDFPTDQNKGIILPMVESLPAPIAPATLANGTFLIHKAAGSGIIKMYQNGEWINLTKGGANLSGAQFDLNPSTATEGRGVVVGSLDPLADNTDGVLVMASTDKGLMLPKVANPHLNVKSPYPGLMCYDTIKEAIAFYDGTGWYYWQ
jgi:hypothetical protein